MARVLCVGHAVQDFVFHVEAMPDKAAKFAARAFESVGGGPAATAAVAISRLGGDALLAARLGDDSIADVITDELQGYGVDCSYVRRYADRVSSLSAVLIDDAGERLIVNHLDPQLQTAADWLPEPRTAGIDAVLADTRWPEGARRAFELARQAGIPAVLDADLPVPRDGELLKAATHIAFSADGLSDYAGGGNLEDALSNAAAAIDGWCCVTVGSRGTLVLGDRNYEYRGAYPVDVKDTLGAGDVWHGAFTLALAEGRQTGEAIDFAGAAAALKVRNGGGRSGTPVRSDLDVFLTEQA